MASLSLSRIGATVFGIPTATPSPGNHTLDATNDGIGVAIQALDTNAITHLGFYYGARTGTPPTYIIGLEGVSATTGNPDGTYKTNGGNCSGTFTPPASAAWDGTWQWVALDNTYTPSLGETLAITVRYSSGTVDASNFSTFGNEISGLDGGSIVTDPYSLRLTAGSWAARSGTPLYGVRSASTRYGNIWQSLYNTATASTVGHRMACKFTLPAGSGDTLKIKGFRSFAVFGATGKNPIAGLWSASAAIDTKTIDTDIMRTPTTPGPREYYFTSSTAINFGTAYYVGFEVGDAASGTVAMRGIQLASSGDLAGLAGGSDWHLATYNGSAWTDDQTVRPFIELILDDITEPAGGGGGGYVIGG